jgi:hypothetical protein
MYIEFGWIKMWYSKEFICYLQTLNFPGGSDQNAGAESYEEVRTYPKLRSTKVLAFKREVYSHEPILRLANLILDFE